MDRQEKCTTTITQSNINIEHVRELAQAEQLDPKASGTRTEMRLRVKAKIFSYGIVQQIVQQLRCRSQQTDKREDRKAKVPECHAISPIPCRSTFEVLLSNTDKDAIKSYGKDRAPWICYHPITDKDRVIIAFET